MELKVDNIFGIFPTRKSFNRTLMELKVTYRKHWQRQIMFQSNPYGIERGAEPRAGTNINYVSIEPLWN